MYGSSHALTLRRSRVPKITETGRTSLDHPASPVSSLSFYVDIDVKASTETHWEMRIFVVRLKYEQRFAQTGAEVGTGM